ncbi:hypothetical protein ABKN59_002658 [Abortiporus biennis]
MRPRTVFGSPMAQGGPELSTEVGDVIGICWLNSMELTTSQQVALCITVPAVISVISASFELKAAKYVQHRYILEKYHAAKDTVEDLMNIEFTPDSLVGTSGIPKVAMLTHGSLRHAHLGRVGSQDDQKFLRTTFY